MARREHFSMPLVCPRCGKTGTVRWEENENPLHHNMKLDRELVSVTEGFAEGTGKDPTGDPEIICTTCKVAVPN